MTSMKQKRIEIEIDSSDEQNASGSESSTPRPLFTPMSSPPSLQSARSSFEVDKPTDTTSTVAENPRDETATQSDIMAIERLGPEARVEAQPESTTVETPRQESHLGAHPVTMVEKSRREPSSAAQLERAIIEKPGQHSFRVAQPVRTTMDKPMSAASGGPLSEKADLERLVMIPRIHC
ncbi:hypothetical protein N431DRAFT_119875 [Stipitochalara longipes BDJ]|nr:hypothetical protein N431DRAFT_119875 [Stipitochalara longipes BDJ]